MTATEAITTMAGPPGRTVRVAGRSYPLVLPSLRDPRLHLASVIITVQILGQTVFDFGLSIAQILVALLTCAVLEIGITFVTKKVVAWPASAMLTGNGVAFVLRVPGTRHGDWWSLRGGWIFAATAAISLLSKYVIRRHGRHVFNPSNFGLLACFLVLGSDRADPLDLWWVKMGPGLAAALAVIVVGGLVITHRTQMLGAAFAFWVTFAAAIGILAASGHCMTARWHLGPVCGQYFWFVLVTSPEILVFLFFMITDPKTAPAGRRARVAHGALVAIVAALLIAPQRSEFGTKVAVLGALAVVCLFRPLLERLSEVWQKPRPRIAIGWSAIACLLAASLVGVGSRARPSSFDARTRTAVAVARPNVRVATTAIPTVTIDAGVRKIDASISAADAQRMVRDLVADLVIEADALKQRQPALAATATAGPRYVKLAREISAATADDELVVSRYRLEHATIVLTRTNFQAGPQIAATVRGTIRRVAYLGASPRRVRRGLDAVHAHVRVPLPRRLLPDRDRRAEKVNAITKTRLRRSGAPQRVRGRRPGPNLRQVVHGARAVRQRCCGTTSCRRRTRGARGQSGSGSPTPQCRPAPTRALRSAWRPRREPSPLPGAGAPTPRHGASERVSPVP